MTNETREPTNVLPTGRRRTWRLAALGIPALAICGAFATTAMARGGEHGLGVAANEQKGERFMQRRLERMMDHVNATPAQESQIKAVFANHKEKIKALHQERRQLHEASRAVLTAPTIDAAAIESVRTKMVAQADKGSRVFAELALQVGQILTQAQRQQMAEHMKHGRGHGPGGPFGF